jgi:hypothetical protein
MEQDPGIRETLRRMSRLGYGRDVEEEDVEVDRGMLRFRRSMVPC